MVQGQAEIEEGVALSKPLAAYFSGRAQIAERALDLHASARSADSDGKGPQLGFSISGSWDDPNVAPDAEGLIRRSNAAAPLLPPASPPN